MHAPLTLLASPPPADLWAKIKRFCSRRQVKGHYAVTRSVLAGLDQLGVRYRYNPPFERLMGSHVWVVAGVDTLEYTIVLKKKGKIQFLAAGPNISVLPSRDDDLLAKSEVDLCIVPSDWVKTHYEKDCPALEGRIRIWAAGVDERYWNPELCPRIRDTVLLYSKSEDAPLADVGALLHEMGLRYTVVRYGKYSPEEYRNALAGSAFAVFLSRSESQGLALAEAWAMDVPTFVWNPGWVRSQSHLLSGVSAAPYLSEQTGRFWNTLHELRYAIDAWLREDVHYFPRKWVLANMTDCFAAKNLLTTLFPQEAMRCAPKGILQHL